MTRPIVAASFLAGITAAGLAGHTFARRWFTAARQVEQAPFEPYLPPRESAQQVEQRNLDAMWTGIVRTLNAADRATPEVGE